MEVLGPPAEKKDFQLCVRGLEQIIPKLMSREVEFIQAKAKEDTERAENAVSISHPTSAIRLKPTSLPKFTGIMHDFHCGKRLGSSSEAGETDWVKRGQKEVPAT